MTDLPYDERLALARAWLDARWVERHEFLSDSDLLDALDQFSTSRFDGEAEDCYPDGSEDRDRMSIDLERSHFGYSAQIAEAATAIGFEPDTTFTVDWEATAPDAEDKSRSQMHRHVAIEWPGGVIWLDMMDFSATENGPHFCIDVRQYRHGKQLPVGVFALEQGFRLEMGKEAPESAPEVTGHGWRGAHAISLLTDA